MAMKVGRRQEFIDQQESLGCGEPAAKDIGGYSSYFWIGFDF